MVARRQVLGLAASAALAPFATHAQPRRHRIGFLGIADARSYATRVEGLRAGLREYGYAEGRNLAIEFRWAEGNYERLAKSATELASLKVEVIVTHGTPGVHAATGATRTIPIVMALSADPVATGIVTRYTQPDANVTGSTYFLVELIGKRFELLKEALPATRRVAVLVNPANPFTKVALQAMDDFGGRLKLALLPTEARNLEELGAAFSAMTAGRADALSVADDAIFLAHTGAIVNLANKARLPSIGFTEIAPAGGLMAYSADNVALFRRAAYFVDRLLKGAKPAELPIERANKFEFVINLKTARALGISIAHPALQRADRVIE